MSLSSSTFQNESFSCLRRQAEDARAAVLLYRKFSRDWEAELRMGKAKTARPESKASSLVASAPAHTNHSSSSSSSSSRLPTDAGKAMSAPLGRAAGTGASFFVGHPRPGTS